MMTFAQAVVLLTASTFVFLSYQSIPANYERIARSPSGGNRFLRVMQSQVGRLFIRYCGVDHMVMALVMTAPVLAGLPMSSTAIWGLCASECVVAFVSIMSAIAIHKEAEH